MLIYIQLYLNLAIRVSDYINDGSTGVRIGENVDKEGTACFAANEVDNSKYTFSHPRGH